MLSVLHLVTNSILGLLAVLIRFIGCFVLILTCSVAQIISFVADLLLGTVLQILVRVHIWLGLQLVALLLHTVSRTARTAHRTVVDLVCLVGHAVDDAAGLLSMLPVAFSTAPSRPLCA